MSIVDRLANRPTRTATFVRPVDPNDAERYAELRSAAAKARTAATVALERSNAKPDDTRLADRAAAATTDADDADRALADFEAGIVSFTIHLAAVPPARANELIEAHPATKEQRTKARKAAGGDPKAEPIVDADAYGLAFLAEAITRIEISDASEAPLTEITVDAVKAIVDGMSEMDQSSLAQTAELISRAPTTVESLGKG